jgi:hypothetical protein
MVSFAIVNVDENREIWDADSTWVHDGEEWSSAWGSSEVQWMQALLPRIRSYVPTQTILEIAPGRGRWTKFLKDLCSRLIVVDLSASCIAACRRTFAAHPHVECHVNDGTSLAMVADDSVDFVFSVDSLVHVDPSVIDAYLAELARKLRVGGHAFLHHSNLGAYWWLTSLNRRPLRRLSGRLYHRIIDDNLRDPAMSAAYVRSTCARVDLQCLHQELINWYNTDFLIDCFSIIKRPGTAERTTVCVKNRKFMRDAARAKHSWLESVKGARQ